MSSSGETALQRRDPRYHVPYGRLDNGDYRRCLWAKPEDFSVPQSSDFPAEPSVPFTQRPEVHIEQGYQPTLFPPRRSKRSAGNRTSTDTVLTTQTRVVGRENRRGWKLTKQTAKVEAKQAKAKSWNPPANYR